MFPITSVTPVISHLHQLLLRSNNEVTAILVAETSYLGKSGKEPLSPLCHPLQETSPKLSLAPSASPLPSKQEVSAEFWKLHADSQGPSVLLQKLHFEVPKTKVGILRQLCPKAHWLIRQWQTLVMEAASPISLSRVIWFCWSFELSLFREEIRYSCWMRCDQNILFLLL